MKDDRRSTNTDQSIRPAPDELTLYPQKRARNDAHESEIARKAPEGEGRVFQLEWPSNRPPQLCGRYPLLRDSNLDRDTDVYELAEAHRGHLERDLLGFADRGIQPIVERTDLTIHARWIARGTERSEIFGVNPEGNLRWLTGPTEDDSYASFLTSSQMADFEQLAAEISRTVPRRPEFVASEALIDSGLDTNDSTLATPEKLAELAEDVRLQAEGRTGLFFIKGDPGAGKTTLLKEATALQAKRYLEGDSAFLFFFVSAQGRELSNLRDAFSGELQDLRAGFTRDGIAALVRAGLLVPIVDGFDELLGTAGYSGAFSSLQSLLVELEGVGEVVVSARSSFYDLEFLGRSANPVNQADLSITTIALQPWTDDQLRKYLSFDDSDEPLEVFELLTEADRQLLRRPFFASEFPGFASAARDGDVTSDLLEYLIAAYIEREAAKIVDATGEPVLPVDGHRRFFELTASEMWESEGRQLSIDDLQTLTEVVAEEFGLGADEATQLGTKVTSYAGFQSGGSAASGEFTFEHEVYFDYFLAKAVARFFSHGNLGDLHAFLDRGVIPEVVANNAVKAISGALPPELLSSSAGIRNENRRRNLGTMVASFARDMQPVEDTAIHGITFLDLQFGPARFQNVAFHDCQFMGVDLCGTNFDVCSANDSRFDALALDDTTQMGIAGIQAGKNVGTVRHPATGDLYAPSVTQKLLEKLGAPKSGGTGQKYSDKATALIALLHRVARAYRRTNVIYETDSNLRRLLDDDDWPELKKLMLDSSVVTEEFRAVSGPKTMALRLRIGVDQLLAGQTGVDANDGPPSRLWELLRAS